MKKTQLFLFHFAGGNCYSYQFLTNLLSNRFEVHALELPGRGKRMSENHVTDLTLAIDDYYTQILEKRSTEPYLIYGHSMGAILGLYVTKRLEATSDSPCKLIVSGNAGPTVGFKEQRYNLPQEEFKDTLRKLGGIAEEVLDHKELFDFFSPIIRADFEVLEGKPLPNTCITTNIHAIIGSEDKHAAQVNLWDSHSEGEVKCQVMNGDHFFINSNPSTIVEQIENYDDSTIAS